MATTAMPDPLECELFLDAIRDGTGAINAGLALGWTPRRIDQMLADPDFSELVDLARLQLLEDIEETLYRKAKAGNRWAVEIVLYNRARERWAPPTQRHEIRRHEVHEVVVASVTASVAELLREHGPRALQPGGVLDVDLHDE